VYLEGEAFFDVSENKEKPFMVHTSGLAIRVLGTAFNVRSYAGEHVVETTLVRGKISLASDGVNPVHQVTLLPNQQALFSKDSGTIALEEAVNTENYISWKNGWMIFDDKPFSYIKETLERGYNVTIVMEDEHSLTCTFSARFKDKTLQEVLEIFKTTESIDYRIAGDRVFIYGRLCEYGNSN
jgi:ferric-dicitrate binding protein FerR (iron transport regulator)